MPDTKYENNTTIFLLAFSSLFLVVFLFFQSQSTIDVTDNDTIMQCANSSKQTVTTCWLAVLGYEMYPQYIVHALLDTITQE